MYYLKKNNSKTIKNIGAKHDYKECERLLNHLKEEGTTYRKKADIEYSQKAGIINIVFNKIRGFKIRRCTWKGPFI